MASLGLIAKAVENLRSLQLHETLNPDHEVKKKEKIANCLALTNSISLANVKAAPQVLNLSIETLICLCDDPDPDVRIMADECLNKIIRAVADSYVLKIQSELYREIGRNGAARCLRAALSRFGLLSHMIRPVRAKYFASQLTPCIVEIAKRKEDIVIEVLSQSLPLILKTLGHYVPDKDIRILLTTFFQNLTSTESVFRRASANMILTTCLNSRKPQHFLNHVIEQLIDTLSQSSQAFGESRNQEDKHINAVLGAFGCLRLLFPQIDSSSALCKEFSDEQLIEHYIGVYELSLHYTNLHVSHNVTNAALEVLSELLNNPPKCVIAILTSSEGLGQRGHKLRERIRQWSSVPSLAAASVASNDDQLESSPNFLESDFIDMPEIAPKVEKWMTEMPDVGSAVEGKSKDSIQIIDTKDLGDYSGLMIGSLDTEDAEVESNASSDVSRLERSIEPNPLSFTGMNEPDDDAAVKEEEEQMELEGEESSGLAEDSTPDQIAQRRLLKLNIGGPRDREVALRYCCRQLGSSFLLDGSAPGQLLPDKLIRVSVKSLTLTCLGRALRLYPEMLFESLVKYNIETCNEQKLTDVLMLAEHSDPQIRGNVMLLIGSFLQGALALKHSSSALSTTEAVLTTENLVKLIVKGLKDESATTSRHTLSALGIFLPSLLESEESVCAKPILKALPGLSRNPYFLVKIKLVEILSELPYGSIEYVNPELKFQERVIEVLLSLLGDADQRVRRAAGNAITRIIPRLHYEGPGEDAVTRKAGRYVEQYICSAIPDPSVFLDAGGQVEYRLLLDSLMRPYQALFKRPSERARARVVDEALSRILGLLAECFLVQSNRYLSQGACEALSLLSETYLTSVHPRAWDCPTRLLVRQTRRHTKLPTSKMENPEQFAGLSNKPLTALSSSLFSHTVILLSSSALSLDLSAHRHLLQLAGNLAAGIACSSCRSKDQAPGPSSANDSAKADAEPTDDFKYWLLFADKSNARNMEKLLVHVMRVLNIFQHVIEDLPSPLQPASKSALPSLTAAHSLSPKRKLLSSSQSSKSKVSATDKSSESHHRLTFRFGGKEQFGSLAGQSHYLRLYELLRAAHSSYRVTLDQEASELYLGLLNATLQVLSQILEMASLNETGRIAEEMLHYLQSTVLLSSTGTVHCVRQLLKSLFGTNLIARWTEVYGAQCRREAREGQTRDEDELGWPEEEARQGFYEQCFQRPARLMSEAIKSTSRNCRGGNEPDTEYRLVGSLQRKEERKISSIMKILSRNTDQNSVSSFIRLFEPLVIKSLIQYTISNSVALQCQVLMLLSQLIHLHINYCLMDSDKIFIGFVMKQFEFIEEGHIAEAKLLLPKIFDFLVRLSYEKYHSKLIIGVPKIIQLCDGLMASGQPPLTHCIPALAPIVEELFLARTTPASLNEEKELETTREVLVSMMLRLAEYPQIVDLLARCLMESRSSADGNGEEKWRRWSRQTVDTVLSMLSTRKLRLESRKAYFALVKLFSSVSPTVFRPVDPLLRVLFTLPPYVGKNLISKNLMDFKRWIGMVNVIILSLVAFAKEEAMLGRLSEVSATIADLPEILLIPDSCRRSSGDPLNVSGRLEPFSMAPDMILARFIFRAIGALSSVVLEFLQSGNFKVLENSMVEPKEKIVDAEGEEEGDKEEADDKFLVQQFCRLMQLCIHMFESGSHCKVANASMQLIQRESSSLAEEERLPLAELNEAMLVIASSCPALGFQWTYLLTLLGYSEMSFWSRIVGSRGCSINAEIARRSATILFCDYLCENAASESERLTWLLTHHSEASIGLADEPPVRELLAVAVHREPKLSALFLQRIVASTPTSLKHPGYLKRLLRCLEGAHQLQSGQLLMLLVPHLLSSKYLVLARLAAKIASRRVEVLLALGKNEAITQLPVQNFESMMMTLSKNGLAKKHEALIGLLNKLAVTHYDLKPLEFNNSKQFDPSEIKNIKLDRSWYLSQVRIRCCQPHANYGCFESAWLLSHLNLDESLNILSSEAFNIKLLHECMIVGTRLTAQAIQQLELDGSTKSRDNVESILYVATERSLMKRIRSVLKLLPEPHQVLCSFNEQNNTLNDGGGDINNYSSELRQLLERPEYLESVFSLLPAASAYVESLSSLSRNSATDYEIDLARLALLCIEAGPLLAGLRDSMTSELELGLRYARLVLREPWAARVFGTAERRSWVCSTAAALTEILAILLAVEKEEEKTPSSRSSSQHRLSLAVSLLEQDCGALREALADETTREYGLACLRSAALVSWLEDRRRQTHPAGTADRSIPDFFREPLESLIVSLARLPLVNSFILTPPLLWKQAGPDFIGTGPTKCEFALFSSPEPDFVPELEVLEEFIFRISLLGWTSRQQFEEIWMVLLGVLNSSQLMAPESSEGSSQHGQTASLAVQAITSLLFQTLILPCPGDPSRGSAIQHPRDPQLSLQKPSTRRLLAVQDLLIWKYQHSDLANDEEACGLEHLFERGNLEARGMRKKQVHGQLSVAYLWSQCALHEDKLSTSTLSLKARRDAALAAASLDVDSCLRFLLELYGSWIGPGARVLPPTRLLHEVVRSALLLSELFAERAQFQWLLDSNLELFRIHSDEDEVLRRYLVVGVSKASAVLTPLDNDTLDKVKRVLETSLKSGSLSVRIATLRGILYLLESAVLAQCEETMAAIHPLAIEYIQQYLDVREATSRVPSRQSEEHQRSLWSLVFFLLEHAEEAAPDAEAPAVLEFILTLLTSHSIISTSLHRMLLQGLERLVATRSIVGKVHEQVVKVAVERLRQPNPALSLPAIQLFLTCMYTDTADRFNNLLTSPVLTAAATSRQLPASSPLAAATTTNPANNVEPISPSGIEPEIERSIERSSAFFDKIKRGYPAEVRILCTVLAEVVVDFFPPLEILTKVIGEFLSPHQPHPRLMSAVVFKVCERACNSSQLDLLQTWVVFSIQNFIQSLPLIMSTWCLSCFFISTSTNPWLRALFPHVQSRIGKYEYEDKKILCLTAADFYSTLTNESQKETFIKTFEDAAKNIGTPFDDLLASLK